MQTTHIDMINNAVKSAKYKLAQHKVQGTNTNLSVLQVARLMDTIKRGEEGSDSSSHSVFFSLN